MPENKKQHFVPKFYLRNFSLKNEGKMIGIYNIPNNKFIAKGDLGNQAYKDYFYGKDGKGEKAIGFVETIVGKVIKNIIKMKVLPQKGSMENQMLLLFIILLVARTEYAENSFNEGIDKFFKKSLMRFYEEKDSIRIRVENAVQSSVKYAALMSPTTFDLSYKLLFNKTKLNFITSDNPAILYNQFLEKRRPHFNNTGFVTKGLEIFLPISNEFCLIFFDDDVYKIGVRKAETILINDSSDVESINALQYISANQNIYFNECFDEFYIGKFTNKFSRYRRTSKVEVKEYPHINDVQKILVQAQLVEVRSRLYLSFVKILRKAQRFQVDNERALISRSEEVLNIAKLMEAISTIKSKAKKEKS